MITPDTCPFCGHSRKRNYIGEPFTCRQCGHEWFGRKKKPESMRICPKCQSYHWNSSEIRVQCLCQQCGHQWLNRNIGKDTRVCPQCHSSIWNERRLSPEEKLSRAIFGSPKMPGLSKELIDNIPSFLDPRERRVLQLRFGLEDGRHRTLKEVGKEFSVTCERIRQIEAKALRKLRHPKLRRFYIEGVK